MELYKGDCLIESDKIESGSVDLILTDLPYGTVKDIKNVNHGMSGKCEWDEVINTNEVYKVANRILRKNGKMVLFAQQPFTNELINKQTPNINFAYSMIWEKDHFANALTAKKAPLNYYEDVLVFIKSGSGDGNKVKEYLIKEKDKAYSKGWTDKTLRQLCEVSLKGGGLLCHYWGVGQWMMPTEKRYVKLQETGFFKKHYSELKKEYKKLEATFNLWEGKKYKSNILKYKKDYDGYHPTQKPVLLLEDLIKTFSNENDLVANKAPVSYIEDILVFSKNYDFEGLHPLRPYFKQVFEFIGGTKKRIIEIIGQRADHVFRFKSSQFDLCTIETYKDIIKYFNINEMQGFKEFDYLQEIDKRFASTFNLWEGKKHKSNILKYKKDYDGHHPTQKPVLLLEDLIKTFSDENDLVVDLTMGSGSTGVACKNTNRDFIGIEMNEEYFKIAEQRINDTK